MFGLKKWAAPVASLVLLAGFAHGVRAEDATPPAKAMITVTVVDSDSKPIPGARVMLYAAAVKKAPTTAPADAADPSTAKNKRPKALQTVTADKDGKAMLKDVADGTYSVAGRMKNFAQAKETVTVADGKDMELTLTLKARAPKPDAAPTPPTN